MTVIVGVRDLASAESLRGDLREKGIAVDALDALPMMLTAHCDLESFPLTGDPRILFLEDGEESFRPAVAVTIDAVPTFGPWPKLRAIRRTPPWPRNGLSLPLTVDFECARTGAGVDVYVVDSGIRASHQEFTGRATSLDGFNPTSGHGTQVASCAAGATVGLASNAAVWAAAGLRNADGGGALSDVLAAINSCLSHYRSRAGLNRPAVLNMSFTGGSVAYATAIEACVDAGLVMCAAAGNDRIHLKDSPFSPALVQGVITVGGLNMADGPYHDAQYGTNHGREIDILAGAQDVRVADFGNNSNYRTSSGTSYACPYVVGILACLLEGYARLRNAQDVYALQVYLNETATYAEYQPDPRFQPMTQAIAYLDPSPGPWPAIPGLVRLPTST